MASREGLNYFIKDDQNVVLSEEYRPNSDNDFIVAKYENFNDLLRQAKDGNLEAKMYISAAYQHGIPEWKIVPDIDKAIGWLESTVDAEPSEKPSLVGTIHQLAVLYDLKGGKLCHQKAYNLYHKAAEFGYVESEFSLAEIYRCGLDGVVEEDIEEAFKWYKKAAGEENTQDPTSKKHLVRGTLRMFSKNTSINAHKRLFQYYKTGECPEKVPQYLKAFHHVNRAAELGDAEAQREIGCIWLKGDCGKLVDVKTARRWLTKAADNGDSEAEEIVAGLSEEKATDVVKSEPCSNETSSQKLKEREVLDILQEYFFKKCDLNAPHPFIMKNPVIYHEDMFLQHPDSPTARCYLKAYRLAEEGFRLLNDSSYTDPRGYNLIAQSYLCENTICNGFPQYQKHLYMGTLQMIFEKGDPKFYEGLVLLLKYSFPEKLFELESKGIDMKKIMAFKNLIHFIKSNEPICQTQPKCNPYEFGNGYGSWLHALYYLLASLYTVAELYQWGADSFQKAVECCPAYYEAKLGLGFCILMIYLSKKIGKDEDTSEYSSLNEKYFAKYTPQTERVEKMSFYAWPIEKLSRRTKEVLMEYLKEAPICDKKYPNGCYHLAYCYLTDGNIPECRKWREQGQNAEGKRLPFFEPVELPIKDMLSMLLDIFPHPSALPVEKILKRCNNASCSKEFAEDEKCKNCPCKLAVYCDRKCQEADWKEHKKICTAKGKKDKTK